MDNKIYNCKECGETLAQLYKHFTGHNTIEVANTIHCEDNFAIDIKNGVFNGGFSIKCPKCKYVSKF